MMRKANKKKRIITTTTLKHAVLSEEVVVWKRVGLDREIGHNPGTDWSGSGHKIRSQIR